MPGPGIKKKWVSWEEFEKIQGGNWTPSPHTHVKVDITDTPWAWADVLKTGSNLTDLATRQHAGLTDVTANQHHAQSHTLASHSTKPHSALTDVLENQHHNKLHSMTGVQHSAAGLTVGHVLRATAADAFAWGFLTKLGTVNTGVWQGTPIANAYVAGIDQNLLQASSPTFNNLTLTKLTIGAFYLNSLIANNKVPDSYKWHGCTPSGLTTGHVLKATGASAIAFQANNLGGLSDITLGTPVEASLLAYNQGGGFWYAGKPEYDIRYKSYDIIWEFWTPSPPSPWAYGAINAGSVSGGASLSHHPGYVSVYSGPGADSGYYWIAANNKLILKGKEQGDFVFKTAANWTSRMNRFGFQDSITIALPTDGAYLDMNGRYLRGVTRKAGVQSVTGTGYNTSASTWYRGRIIVNSNASLITFLLFNSSGTQLWTNSLATNIPTALTGFGTLGYYTAASEDENIITMDLAYLVCARGLVR